MRTFWVFVFLVVATAACSPGDSGTTTSGPAAASSSVASTVLDATTTTAVIVTTIEPTTTTSPVTTTLAEATTTTSGDLDGVWAPQPLIVAAFGALGWWDGESWVQVNGGTSLPINGGEDYQVARLGLEAVTSGGTQGVFCDPLETPGVELGHPELLGSWPGPYGVAISASWPLRPHLVEEISDDGTYSAFARDLLESRGLTVADPVIKQLVRTDLEGDGVNEVVVVAEEITGDYQPPTEGDYSIVFMRKVVDGEVRTAVLDDSIIVDPETDLNLAFGIGAIADLSGDGVMEIVVSSAYYEGLGVEVWQYFNDDLGMIPTVQAGCGA